MAYIKGQFIEAWKAGKLKVGEITLLSDRAVVTFKKGIKERRPKGYASIDINLMSLDILKAKNHSISYQKIDLKKLYGVRVHYFKKCRKIQKLSKHKPKTSRRLEEKYAKHEKQRVKR